MSKVAKVTFVDYKSTVFKALDLICAGDRLPDDRLIIIKPNVINSDGPPVTTNVKTVEAVYKYCKAHSSSEIVIGEGCGSGVTSYAYAKNGYDELAQKYGIKLIDFNNEKAVLVHNDDALALKQFYIPEIALEAFIISVPVLKDHSFTKTTIAMKNMFGIAPEPYYSGSWNKSKLHSPSTDKAVVDICLYKKPEISVVDAVLALQGMHLSGTPRQLNTILAGFDPVAVDAVGSKMLGHNPKDLKYLRLAHGIIGDMENIEIVTESSSSGIKGSTD